jgi:hypothetical protein
VDPPTSDFGQLLPLAVVGVPDSLRVASCKPCTVDPCMWTYHARISAITAGVVSMARTLSITSISCSGQSGPIVLIASYSESGPYRRNPMFGHRSAVRGKPETAGARPNRRDWTRSGHEDRHCRSHAFLTISKPLAVNSFRMLLAKWEHSSGLIQVALLQSGSSSLEYAVNADRIPASIALVASSAMRPSTTSLTTASWHSHGSVDVDQRCSAGEKT